MTRELEAEVERWKSIAEANGRSYCVTRDALEMTRKRLEEMTQYRDNSMERLKWSEGDLKVCQSKIQSLKADLAREKKQRREAARAAPKRRPKT